MRYIFEVLYFSPIELYGKMGQDGMWGKMERNWKTVFQMGLGRKLGTLHGWSFL